jgi:chromosomal replication initiation ATPase DnaA
MKTNTSNKKVPFVKQGQTKWPLLENILIDVARYFKKPVTILKESDSHAELVLPRRIYCYVAWSITNATLHEIGAVIGKKHSSVSHLRDTAAYWIKTGQHEFVDEWLDYLKDTNLWGAYEKIR